MFTNGSKFHWEIFKVNVVHGVYAVFIQNLIFRRMYEDVVHKQ
jgi:hypothetical protein